MPKEMDTAFYDRIHAYLPGWEFGMTRDKMLTDHSGLVSVYLAEALHELRKDSYTDDAESYLDFINHIGGRDAKVINKMVNVTCPHCLVHKL